MVVVLSALFLLTETLPGDYADTVAGADRARAEQLREQWGLNTPVLLRLAEWWGRAIRGDLGVSLVTGQPVLPRVLARLEATLVIAVPSVLLAAICGVGLAFALAWFRDRTSGTTLSFGVSAIAGLPEVVLIVSLVLLFSVAWGLLPPVSLTDPRTPLVLQWKILVLPILALTIPHAAWGARMLRGSADDLLASELVASARRRGVPARRIAYAHVFPRWIGPIVQVSAYLAAGVLGGSVVVESMLAYPGLGQMLASAVASRDVPTVQVVGAVIVGVSLTLLTLADLIASRAERRT